jgi:tetratricopeptide (TPR) repeat protein
MFVRLIVSPLLAADSLTPFGVLARERAVRAVSLFGGSRSERTFAIGLALLAAVAVAQVIAALVFYLQRSHESGAAVESTSAASGTVAVSSRVAGLKTPPAAGASDRLTITQSKAPRGAGAHVSVPDELLQVAKALRLHGDTANAIAKLQQAAALDPQNAEVLAELALTYESMQLFDRSNDTWRKLQALGAAAGPLVELAELKLREGVPVQGIPGATGRPPTDAAAPNDASIPDGSSFGISQVTQTNIADSDAVTHLTLRVGVKRQPNLQIDYSKVKIQVFFYDVVNNEQVLLTDAEVSYDWVTPAHNWADTDTEVLDVTYLRRKKHYPVPGTALGPVPDSVEKATRKAKGKRSEEAAPNESEGTRQYLGYIVRVYYKDELQAVRADPTRLLNLFPPPFTAPPQ